MSSNPFENKLVAVLNKHIEPGKAMITIRTATPNDVAGLNQLIAHSARELSRGIYTDEEIEGAIEFVFGVDSELVEDESYFVIEKNNEIVGCGGWSRRKTLFGGNQYRARDDGIYLNPAEDAAKIRAFFIHPQWARQGLGTVLLEYCEQQARDYGFSQCEMMATLPGVLLYQKLGYLPLSDEILLLANQQPLRLVKMTKELR